MTPSPPLILQRSIRLTKSVSEAEHDHHPPRRVTQTRLPDLDLADPFLPYPNP